MSIHDQRKEFYNSIKKGVPTPEEQAKKLNERLAKHRYQTRESHDNTRKDREHGE